MKLALNKCHLLNFRGSRAWNTHIDLRIQKANTVLPVLLYGLNCAYQSRTDQRKLKNFQRGLLKWVCGHTRGDYIDCYLRILEAILKNRKAVICGDLIFPSTNWLAYWSNDKKEPDVHDILEERLLRQGVDFAACGKDILDVLLYQNCEVLSQIDISFKTLYDCSDHLRVVSSVEIGYQQEHRTKNVTTVSPKRNLTVCCATCHQTFFNFYASQMQITCTTNSRTTP